MTVPRDGCFALIDVSDMPSVFFVAIEIKEGRHDVFSLTFWMMKDDIKGLVLIPEVGRYLDCFNVINVIIKKNRFSYENFMRS